MKTSTKTKPAPKKTKPRAWKAPPVRPWPSKELRQRAIDTLAMLERLDPHERNLPIVREETMRGLVEVQAYYGPAVVCTRAEWTAARGRARAAEVDGPERALTIEDLDRLASESVEARIPASAVGELGRVVVSDYDRERFLVRGKPDENGTRILYMVEGLGECTVRVRAVGMQHGPIVAPSLVTEDDEGILLPGYDDVARVSKGAA